MAVRTKQSVARASKEAAARPRASPVVTLKRLAANLSESHQMSKKQTEAVLGDLVGLVTKHLKRGDRIRLGGLSIRQVRKRATRMGRNPATAERIQLLGPAVIRGKPQQKEVSRLFAEQPAEGAYEPSPRALALLRGKKISESDLKESGGSFSLQDVETLLGISRQAIDKKVDDDALFAVSGPHGRRRYPVVQFTDKTDDRIIPGLQKVLKSLPSTNGWFRLNFLITPDDHLGGQRPIDLLMEDNIDPVVAAAKAIGLQGA